MTQYTLTYFDMRGRAEVIRLFLAYAGVAYDDRGVAPENWPAMKPASPLGQIPFLTEKRPDGSRDIPQTMAILRHLARVHGLDGKNEDEKVAADVALETALDLRNALNQLRFSPLFQDEGAKAKFAKETAPVHFVRLEKLIGDREWFAGNAPTFADFYVFDTLERLTAIWLDILGGAPKLAAFQRRIAALPQLADYLRTRRAA